VAATDGVRRLLPRFLEAAAGPDLFVFGFGERRASGGGGVPDRFVLTSNKVKKTVTAVLGG